MESLIRRLIYRLCMQNAVVFNTYYKYISRILGTDLMYMIETAEA
jgi:predicted nuclease of restriction endonuclease-like RecB superfamily